MRKKLLWATLSIFLVAPLFFSFATISGVALLFPQQASQMSTNFCAPAASGQNQLPTQVPEKLRQIFEAAAEEHGTDPIALAVVFSNENGWNFDRPLAPPYGEGPAWPTSGAGAQGPFQFLGSTWLAYRNANPAHQPGNIQDLTDATYGAAMYLSHLGAKVGTPLGSPDGVTSDGTTVISAIVRYHSGDSFRSLGPYGRQYAQKGYDMYRRLAANGTAGASSATPPPACNFKIADQVKGYPSTVGTPCAPGTRDAGIQQTAKGNVLQLCDVGGGIVVNTTISGQILAMRQAAASSGINLTGGGFRSAEGQIQARIRNGCPDVYSSPSRSCRVPTARPGESQHEQGLAIDFERCGWGSPSNNWLKSHAATYGMKNYPAESWHWSVNGH